MTWELHVPCGPWLTLRKYQTDWATWMRIHCGPFWEWTWRSHTHIWCNWYVGWTIANCTTWKWMVKLAGAPELAVSILHVETARLHPLFMKNGHLTESKNNHSWSNEKKNTLLWNFYGFKCHQVSIIGIHKWVAPIWVINWHSNNFLINNNHFTIETIIAIWFFKYKVIM